MPSADFRSSPDRFVKIPRLGRVCRLGLATRGNTCLEADDVLQAIERGVNYLNWCGHADGMQAAIRNLGSRRKNVSIAVQLSARRADEAQRELDWFHDQLATDYLDVVTYYYVESESEWNEILGQDGAARVVEAAREEGRVRCIGLTSHQRPLAAQAAKSGRLDLLMVRYNAAHRGAERDVFPSTTNENVPVVAFTCLRWGALLKATPDDPPGFVVPSAYDWYRFVLCQPAVAVALMAPNGREELLENLTLLDDWHGLSPAEQIALQAHGDRVHRHGGSFP
jgi:predicted aldo/keto reductase-like oxidoreductase